MFSVHNLTAIFIVVHSWCHGLDLDSPETFFQLVEMDFHEQVPFIFRVIVYYGLQFAGHANIKKLLSSQLASPIPEIIHGFFIGFVT